MYTLLLLPLLVHPSMAACLGPEKQVMQVNAMDYSLCIYERNKHGFHAKNACVFLTFSATSVLCHLWRQKMLYILPLRLGKVCAMLVLVLFSICKGDLTYTRYSCVHTWCTCVSTLDESHSKPRTQVRV